MNYLALAGALMSGLIALYCLTRIVIVATGRKRFRDGSGFLLNALAVSVFGTLAAWLVSMVAA